MSPNTPARLLARLCFCFVTLMVSGITTGSAQEYVSMDIAEIEASSQISEAYNGKPQTAERLLETDEVSTFWRSATTAVPSITMTLAEESNGVR